MERQLFGLTVPISQANNRSMAAASPELWLYLDAVSGQQKGPVPELIVKRLLRKGIVLPEQLVWTQRLPEWAAIASVEPFASYCRVWTALWYYMADSAASSSNERERSGPVSTQNLVKLFVDGAVDGMTLVWSQDMDEWKPIGEVPSLKEFLQEANDDLDREAELQEQTEEVPIENQIFEKVYVLVQTEALMAEDGKQYVFDTESKTYVTPEDKIEEDLASLREAAGEIPVPKQQNNAAGRNGDNSKAEKPDGSPAPTPADSKQDTGIAAGEDITNKRKTKKKKKKKSDKWKKRKTNTWVYVNGLPLDVSVQEVHDHFAKCGVIQSDIATGEPRIKLYHNKADGGLNEASVELAVELLDKSQIRPEWPIDVSPAVFTQKGEEFVKRKKPKIDTRAKIKMFEQAKVRPLGQPGVHYRFTWRIGGISLTSWRFFVFSGVVQALSWNEGEVGEPAGLRIVVIKHMFTPDEITDEEYEKELQEDIHGECSKIGEVSKITLFSKREDGVVVIKFASSGSAARCVEVMNGRFFAGRKLECGFWDGTNYTHHESKHEEKERADKFKEWLEQSGSSSSESEEEEEEKANDEDLSQGERVHSGRELPPLDDDSDDSDVESNGDDEDPSATGEEVHARRVMPNLDDLVDDEGGD
ncbi:hypothetical protein BBJ28_00019659 [Nothophytophthora sp. Chile5]|nr:hypothetical protein BBJ28_00019659 [Nothophytophthora sp. Chile5]